VPPHPNPLTAYGGRVYSQNDEDGLTFEILRRIGRVKGVFCEFGVGDGLENNTLALVAAGWSGFWVGGEDLAFTTNPGQASNLRFHYEKRWVTRSNIVELYGLGLGAIRESRCDVMSLDLDGNDYYFVEALLKAGAAPDLFIVEYNAKFMPPIRFKIDYQEDHRWQTDDYYGASLCSYNELFERHGYFLACCSLAGVNAFFVKQEHRSRFAEVPREIESLYSPARHFLSRLQSSGHKTSLRTIEKFFSELNS